jgi:hypothetical protein
MGRDADARAPVRSPHLDDKPAVYGSQVGRLEREAVRRPAHKPRGPRRRASLSARSPCRGSSCACAASQGAAREHAQQLRARRPRNRETATTGGSCCRRRSRARGARRSRARAVRWRAQLPLDKQGAGRSQRRTASMMALDAPSVVASRRARGERSIKLGA